MACLKLVGVMFLNFPPFFSLYREAKQADVPEGGRLSVTCIASGAKPQAYIYWNSEPKLNNTTVRSKNIFIIIYTRSDPQTKLL